MEEFNRRANYQKLIDDLLTLPFLGLATVLILAGVFPVGYYFGQKSKEIDRKTDNVRARRKELIE